MRILLVVAMLCGVAGAQSEVGGWRMQDAAAVKSGGESVSAVGFESGGWYKAVVPGTVLTTLVENKVYPEPLYGENMRAIPESLNKTSWWYRTEVKAPVFAAGRHVWLHFGGVNYAATVWVNGRRVGQMKGAFVRGDFDVTAAVKPGEVAGVAVLVNPQPHPGVPHEHTVANGMGRNGGETALDGPTFLASIGWDWMPAVRDRDTGIWLPVTMDTTGPVLVKDVFVTSKLNDALTEAEVTVHATLVNLSEEIVDGAVELTLSQTAGLSTTLRSGRDDKFVVARPLKPKESAELVLTSKDLPWLRVEKPQLWWPNGYGAQSLYQMGISYRAGAEVSSKMHAQFGVRKMDYAVKGSEFLTISVNNVPIMIRGGDWGMDEAMKRTNYTRLNAAFRMHAMAHMNMIRNWVGQSTRPVFYELADKYGMLLWDEFFQPNPSDGPDPADEETYITNVRDKVLRYRNHPSIAVWCARNEGYPPKALDDRLKAMMAELDPTRTYQSNSADGRGVASGGPYHWRSPEKFYVKTAPFKTETGSVSVPTLESVQGMMPKKDWETINDDWAQHDMAAGAQRGNEYPHVIAARYGLVRNLADFVRKAQLANYEAFRAMYESRNAEMFRGATGVITWMSHPAQPSFVWQLYHYDLEPNASLFAVTKAAEPVHVQLNEMTRQIEIVNNHGPLTAMKVKAWVYSLDGAVASEKTYPVEAVAGSTTLGIGAMPGTGRASGVYFLRLELQDARGNVISRNFYWQNLVQDAFTELEQMPKVKLRVSATSVVRGDVTRMTVSLTNDTRHVAVMTHLQLHAGAAGERVLPVFYSDNYLSLAPSETRTVEIEVDSKDLHGVAPVVEMDGFNLEGVTSIGTVRVKMNENADPMRSPETNLVR